MSAIIEAENLSFAYQNDYLVLENVNLKISQGEFVSIIGPNGGGKTTLLKLFLGRLRPTKGKIWVQGRHPAVASRQIGFVPQHSQHDHTFPIKVLQVVLMGRLGIQKRGWGYSQHDRQIARECLEEVGLASYTGRSFFALSGGQKQRVLIARALATQAPILVLDEPMSNVDMAAEQELYKLLKKLHQRHTILLVSHDLAFVSTLVESVICVNRQVSVHPTSNITGEVIEKLYGSKMKMIHHDHRCTEKGHQCPNS